MSEIKQDKTERVQEAPVTQLVLEKKFARNSKGDTTPSVLNIEKLIFTNTGAVLVTRFDDGQPNQEITMLGDGFTTIENNLFIETASGANTLLAAGKVYRFTKFSNKWHEDAGSSGGGGGAGATGPRGLMGFPSLEIAPPLEPLMIPGPKGSAGTGGTGSSTDLDKALGWFRAPASPNAMDDEFTAASLDLVKWEKFNHGTSIIDTEPLVRRLIMETPTGAANALRILRQPAPSGAFSFETCLQPYTNAIVSSSRFCGLIVRSSGASGGVAGRIMAYGFWLNGVIPGLNMLRYTDENTWLNSPFGIAMHSVATHTFNPPYWFKLEWTGTVWNFYINQDGDPSGWQLIGSDTNAHLGSAFSHIGLFVHCNTAAIKHRVAFHHFRVT